MVASETTIRMPKRASAYGIVFRNSPKAVPKDAWRMAKG